MCILHLLLLLLCIILALFIIHTIRNGVVKTGGAKYESFKLPSLPKGIKFQKGPGKYKYTALVPMPDNKIKTVHFGHRDYQHYKDSVPKSLGGKLWSRLDHKDKDRRKRYRTRHKGVLNKDGRPAYKVRYTPAWFSYYWLW